MKLAAAHRYLKLGWPVLPLWWLEQGRCVCVDHGACRRDSEKHAKCEPGHCKLCAPGKHPIGFVCRGGALDASLDRRRVDEWFRRYPAANIGIACERFIVLDIDPRNGGHTWMADQVSRYARLPETPTARTGADGWHFLFRPPSFELRGACHEGVDIKKRGGYIVAAPSTTLGRYRWLRPPETPLAELPAWLQPLCKRPDPPKPIRVAFDGEIALDRRVARAMAYCETCEPAVEGQNGSKHTFRLAQHVALGFALPEDAAYRAMAVWNARCSPPWSEHDLRRKIRQALEGRGQLGLTPGCHLGPAR